MLIQNLEEVDKEIEMRCMEEKRGWTAGGMSGHRRVK